MPSHKLALGRLTRTHGLKGELWLDTYSGETEHLTPPIDVWVGAADRCPAEQDCRTAQDWRAAQIETIRAQSSAGRVIVRFAGVDSVEGAKAFRGQTVWVDRSNATPLGEDEFYVADLVGLSVIVDGHAVGRVASTWENGHNWYLEVEAAEGRRVQVPFIGRFVGMVDLERRTVEVLEAWVFE
jgi:16S rRNA processing protein RimM